MYKNLLIASLSLGVSFMSSLAYSDSATRFKQSQSSFTQELSFVTPMVEDLLENNPGIQVARAKIKASTAAQNAASQALYNPELELDYENTEINTGSIGLSQTIDWSDKRGGRTRVSLLNNQKSKIALMIAEQSLAAEFLHSLSQFHTAQDKNALTKLRIELLREFVDVVKKRYLSGGINQSQLSLAQLAFAEASMQRTRIASQLTTSHQLLITLTGNDQSNWPGLSTQLPELLINDMQFDALINELPKFVEQGKRIEAAMAKVKLRSLEKNADPTISLRAGREDNDNLVGITLSIPLNVRNTYKAEVNIANAELIQEELKSQDLQRKIKSQLRSTANRYQLTLETWKNWSSTGASSMTNQFDLIHQQWQASEISATDYFLQLNQTLDTRLSAIELRQDLWSAWIDWLKASSKVLNWLNVNSSDINS